MPLNPLVTAWLAACAVVTVLASSSFAVSAAVFGLAALLALVFPRCRPGFGAAVVMSLSAAIGLSAMYAPFTPNGWRIAAEYSLKLAAAMSSGLAIGGFLTLDGFMRAAQGRLPARVLYVVGSTLRLYPLAKVHLIEVRQTLITRGITHRRAVIVPLVVSLINDAALRVRPLQRTGIGAPGHRSVLRPLPWTALDSLVMVSATVLTITVITVSVTVGS